MALLTVGLSLGVQLGCGDDEGGAGGSGGSTSSSGTTSSGTGGTTSSGTGGTTSSGTGGTTSSSGTGGTTSSSGTGGTTSSSGTGGTTSSSGTGGGPLCVIAPSGECTDPDTSDACVCCAAENCFDQADACCNEAGCMVIVDCAIATGCEGFGCYSPQTCKSEIDANGGPFGAAAGAAGDLSDCVSVACPGC